MSLRNKLIRLAHTNPELRADLLPVLKESADKKAAGKTLGEGWTELVRDFLHEGVTKWLPKAEIVRALVKDGWKIIRQAVSNQGHQAGFTLTKDGHKVHFRITLAEQYSYGTYLDGSQVGGKSYYTEDYQKKFKLRPSDMEYLIAHDDLIYALEDIGMAPFGD